jgi:hypothetical protein
MAIYGKGNGSVLLSADGGVKIGTSSNVTCINGNCLSKSTDHDLCFVGYDTPVDNAVARDVHIRGGSGFGLNSNGGNLILCSGTGTNGSGRIRFKNIPAKTSETNILYIDGNGAISSGVGSTGNTVTSINYQIIGNNVTKDFTITHNLGTQYPMVQVIEDYAPYSTIYVTVERTSIDAISIKYNTAPSNGEKYRVIIVK